MSLVGETAGESRRSGGLTRPLDVFLVEDTVADALLVTKMIEGGGYSADVRVVSDGETALDFLFRRGSHSVSPTPDFVLLDINLPRKDGFEVLSEIRKQPQLAGLPVFLLTSSRNAEDIARGRSLNVASFLTKPSQLAEFESLIERLFTVELPKVLPVEKARAQEPVAPQPRRSEVTEQEFRLFVEAVSDYAVFLLDPNGYILTWNEGARRLNGYEAKDIIGKHFSLFYPREVIATGHPADELKRAVEEGRYQEEGWRLKKDGSRFWALVTITAVRDKNGVHLGFSKVTRDMSEVREREEALKRAHDELERQVAERTRELEASKRVLERQEEELLRSNRELNQFAYIASHDLQEPLRAVAMYLQLLKKRNQDKLEPEDKECIDFAVDGALRMKLLIEDLLAFARVGGARRRAEPVNAHVAVEEALANLNALVVESGARVTVSRLPTLKADLSELVQIFQNLLCNAIKYRSGNPPEITVSAAELTDRWIFQVRDNGIGLSPEYVEKIFLPFQRLHGDRRKYPGTGIGLAICKKIVERINGRIWVESESGRGAAFFFSIPK